MNKSRVPKSSANQLFLTCEHAGNQVPREYAALFRDAADVLSSHRGWDPGALEVAQSLARKFDVSPNVVFWSRLLVESNRAPSNPRIWSKYTAGLPAGERERILARYWWPHRHAVNAGVGEIVGQGRRVIHIAVHSFTAILDGEVRNADIGLLYDPGRPGELALCKRWEQVLHELDPALRVRRNYPYRGIADGLPTWLRRKFPDDSYMGVELEFSQALIGTPRWRSMKSVLATSVARLLAESVS